MVRRIANGSSIIDCRRYKRARAFLEWQIGHDDGLVQHCTGGRDRFVLGNDSGFKRVEDGRECWPDLALDLDCVAHFDFSDGNDWGDVRGDRIALFLWRGGDDGGREDEWLERTKEALASWTWVGDAQSARSPQAFFLEVGVVGVPWAMNGSRTRWVRWTWARRTGRGP